MPVQTPPKKTSSFESPEVRVVEASAGSGKTYALAKRYVQLLLNPTLVSEDAMRNILAITFTNKAAFEMKARILEFLKKLALQQISQEDEENILSPIGISKDVAAKEAYAIMDKLIRNYNFFQVQTIDKFINALLSGCAFKIGLTANFKIKTNSKEYLEYSLDEIIDQAQKSKSIRNIFENFLHHYLYLENRTGWFPKDDILDIVYTLFKQNNAYGLKYKESHISQTAIIKKKRLILESIKSLQESLPGETDKRFATSLERFLNKNVNSFDIDNISDYFAREDFPIRKNADVPKSIDRLWTKIHKNLKDLCEAEAYSLFNPYIEIFDYVISGFYDLSVKDDVLFLEELNKRAGLLFDEDYVTVEELYYRLATRFHHYLIDEFQDTSRLQWHNLEKMAEEALSTGGSLFYVGDRKQAIYGFRGGEVELFDKVKSNFGAFNVQTNHLTNNWRSQRQIVEFNNAVFSLDNVRRFLNEKENYEREKKKRFAVSFTDNDVRDLENVLQDTQQTFQPENNSGYVKIEYIDIDKKEERDELIREKLIKLIKDLRKRFSYRDIAILSRGNQEVEMMTNWLLEENILVESDRTSDITENRLIQEIIAFLKFLHSPIDNKAFTDFILGDIFSAATGLSSEKLHHFVFTLRERIRNEKGLYIYTEFRKQYENVWQDFIDEFFKNVGLFSLYELVISFYGKFACLNNFSEYQGFFMHLLELIKSQEDEHNDIASFLDYYEELAGEDLYVNVTDSDAIKILTIHKSKGLEFPVVILPFLGMDIQVGIGNDNRQSYIMQMDTEGIELLRLKQKYFNFSDSLFAIHSREYKKAFLCELNNIYVAMTRPQHELHAFIPKRVGSSFNFVKFFIPEENYEKGEPYSFKEDRREEGSDQSNTEILKLPCSQFHNWIEYLKEEFSKYDEILTREQRLRGSIIHFILSEIGNLHEQNVQDVIDRAIEEAKMHYANIENVKEYQSLVKKLVTSKKIKPFFDIDEGEVFNEKEIVTEKGHTKRLDRLIVKKDKVWVVDFKSSKENLDENVAQVQEYVKIVKKLYPQHSVEGYLIFLDKMGAKKVHE